MFGYHHDGPTHIVHREPSKRWLNTRQVDFLVGVSFFLGIGICAVTGSGKALIAGILIAVVLRTYDLRDND